MSSQALRFVHSADWHLERPVGGLAHVPDPLRSRLIDAPYDAARRVVDAAISEHAELVVLSGDVMHVGRAGPRAIEFLVAQFERLASRKIEVYWAGGQVDAPEQWPEAVTLPDNVHRFRVAQVETVTYHREGVPAARLVGRSPASDQPSEIDEFHAATAGLPTIAVLHSELETKAIAASGIVYWALGSRHQRTSVKTRRALAHHPGTPQGRNPHEAGPHGCTLVELDGDCAVQTAFIPTDSIRWHRERIDTSEVQSVAVLENLLRGRAEKIAATTSGVTILVDWRLSGDGPLRQTLRQGRLTAELLESLHKSPDADRPTIWSTAVELEPPETWPETILEQDTLLGEFIRETLRLEGDVEARFDLTAYRDEAAWLASFVNVHDLDDPRTRRWLLRSAAELGADLLSYEGTRP